MNPSNKGQGLTTLIVLKRCAAPFLIILASFAFVAMNAPAHSEMSPFDEYVYIDYLVKFPEQGIVRQGEPTGEIAREHYSCDGVSIFGKSSPENCATGDFAEDEDYPMDGLTSADLYTPAYFAVTWAAAQPVIWLTDADIVEAGRIAGWIWLATAGIFLYYSLRRLNVSPVARFGACGLLIASAASWWSTTYISTDGSAMATGAALLYLMLRYIQSGRGAWLLVLASVLAVLLKFQNFMMVATLVIFLIIMLFGRNRRSAESIAGTELSSKISTRAASLTLASMIVLPLVTQVIWMMIRSSIAVDDFPDQGVETPLTLTELIQESLKFYGKTGLSTSIPSSSLLGWALAAPTTWILTAAVIALIAIEPRFSTKYALAVALLIAQITAGPALALANLATQGYYFELPLRYGLSLFPVSMALGAVLLDRKFETRWGFACVAAATFAVSLTPYFPGDMFVQ